MVFQDFVSKSDVNRIIYTSDKEAIIYGKENDLNIEISNCTGFMANKLVGRQRGRFSLWPTRPSYMPYASSAKKFLPQAPLPGPFSSASRYFRKKSNKGGSLTTIDIPDVMGYVAYKQY